MLKKLSALVLKKKTPGELVKIRPIDQLGLKQHTMKGVCKIHERMND